MDLAAPRDRIGARRRGVRQPRRVTGDRGVARLEAASGVSFQHIATARAETERRLVERRSRTASVQVDEDAAVVLMGSWGRREVTSASDDDDFMVLLVTAPRDNALPSIEDVADALGGRPPGPEEIFGRQVLLDELRGKIGRDEDTDANLTRRMLLMLESVAICGDSVHSDARRVSLQATSRQTSRTTGRRGSCSTTSSANGGPSRLTLRARCALGKARTGGFAMPSSGSRVRLYSPAGFSRSLSATGNPPAPCSPTSMSACRHLRLTGSPTRSSIAAPSTPAYEHSTPRTNSWRFSTTARAGGS
jgi:hypothetical protein